MPPTRYAIRPMCAGEELSKIGDDHYRKRRSRYVQVTTRPDSRHHGYGDDGDVWSLPRAGGVSSACQSPIEGCMSHTLWPVRC